MKPTNTNSKAQRAPVSNKIIKVTANLKVTSHDFPEGDLGQINHKFHSLIGCGCSGYEVLYPTKLFDVMGINAPILMLVDEDGKNVNKPVNLLASYLYDSFEHGDMVVGDVIFIGVDSEDFCGIDGPQFTDMYQKLKAFCIGAKGARKICDRAGTQQARQQ